MYLCICIFVEEPEDRKARKVISNINFQYLTFKSSFIHHLLLMTIMIESKLEGEGSSPAAHASSLSSADAGEEEHTRQVTIVLMLSLVMVVTVWEKRNTFDGWMVMLTGLGFADGGDVDVGDGGGSHGCVGENRDQVGDPLDGGGGV